MLKMRCRSPWQLSGTSETSLVVSSVIWTNIIHQDLHLAQWDGQLSWCGSFGVTICHHRRLGHIECRRPSPYHYHGAVMPMMAYDLQLMQLSSSQKRLKSVNYLWLVLELKDRTLFAAIPFEWATQHPTVEFQQQSEAPAQLLSPMSLCRSASLASSF